MVRKFIPEKPFIECIICSVLAEESLRRGRRRLGVAFEDGLDTARHRDAFGVKNILGFYNALWLGTASGREWLLHYGAALREIRETSHCGLPATD